MCIKASVGVCKNHWKQNQKWQKHGRDGMGDRYSGEKGSVTISACREDLSVCSVPALSRSIPTASQSTVIRSVNHSVSQSVSPSVSQSVVQSSVSFGRTDRAFKPP